eukprot:359268-Chlamydomonas_euryale.AAC.1
MVVDWYDRHCRFEAQSLAFDGDRQGTEQRYVTAVAGGPTDFVIIADFQVHHAYVGAPPVTQAGGFENLGGTNTAHTHEAASKQGSGDQNALKTPTS